MNASPGASAGAQLPCQGGQFPQPLGDDRREQRLLGGEVAVHRPLRDAGPPGDLTQVCFRTDATRTPTGRGEDLRAVVARVSAERTVVHRQKAHRSSNRVT